MAKILAVLAVFAATAHAKRFVDLTYPLNKDVVLFPGRTVKFNTENKGEIDGIGWVASNGFCIGEHTSTHMDAPYHFNKNGWKLDDIPFEYFLDIPGVCIDVSSKVNQYDEVGRLKVVSNYVATREDIIEWETTHGQIPQKSIVLLRTGWGTKWTNADEYRGTPIDRRQNKTQADLDQANSAPPTLDFDVPLNFPGFDASAAKFLTSERNVIGVGIDTLSLDPGSSKTFPAHKVFLNRGIYLLENVANLHLLPATGFRTWAVPFKIDAGTGAPTRVFAQILDPEDKKQ